MNKYWRYVSFYFSIFFLLAFGAPTSIKAASLQAIIVADTFDLSIGDGASADLQKMRYAIQQIAKQTKLALKQDIIAGKNATPAKLLAKLNELKIKNNDVIIFFFSGHGYRTPSKND